MAGRLVGALAGLTATAARLLRGPVTPAPTPRSDRERDDEHEQQERWTGDEQVAQNERHPASYAPAILGMGSGAFAISP